MKKILLFAALTFFSATVTIAQNNVGINNPNPAASAVLDITSSNQGILVPRMATSARNTISAPAKGLLVFDSSFNSFYFHNGTTWTALRDATNTYPNVELSTSGTTQQTISSLFGQSSFTQLSLSATNNANALLTGGNSWNGSTFTVGTNGAGWYEITGNFVGVTSGSNNITTIGYQVVVDKNNSFTNAPTAGTYPLAFGSYNSSITSSFLRNLATIQTVVYLTAGDYLNLRAQSWSTSTAAYTSTDGSTYLTIVRLK